MNNKCNSFLLLAFLSITLSSCGGGDSTSVDNTNLNEIYNGNKSPARLTEQNTAIYSRMLLGNSYSEWRRFATLGDLRTDISNILQQLALLNNTTPPSSNTGEYNLSLGITNRHCTHGGSYTKDGDISGPQYTGTVTYIFSECQISDDITYNGKASITSFSYHLPRSSILKYDNLSLNSKGTVYNILGTVEKFGSYQDENEEIFKDTRIRNLLISNSENSFSTYFEDVFVETTTSYIEYTTSSTVSGKIYLQGDGYITLSNSSNYLSPTTNYYGDVVTQLGDIYFTGNNSSSKLTRKLNSEEGFDTTDYRMDIDTDGDSIYELTSIDSYRSNKNSNFSQNQAPSSEIRVTRFKEEYCAPQDNNFFNLGHIILLNSECSKDLENDVIEYEWQITTQPEGSSTVLNENKDSEFNSFNVDARGTYQVSLKTTDPDGSSNNNISVVDITISNSSPSASVNYISNRNSTLGQSINFEASFSDRDSVYSDTSERDILTTYEWTKKPMGSLSEITLVESNKEGVIGEYGISMKNQYTFIPDKKGEYFLTLTATDFEGKTNTFPATISFVID